MQDIKKIYKRTKTGAVQTWSIEVVGNKFRTHEGQLNGAITTSEWTICESKNIGKKNETSPEKQAQLEADAKYKKKLESGYWESIEDIDKQQYFEPMLAHKWESYKSKTQYPVYTQGKLDGIRCIATSRGLYSRNGKEIIAVPHIQDTLQKLFQEYPNLVLDGELYNHNLKENFNKIVSVVRKTKPTSKDLEESKKIAQYHIYDCYLGDKSKYSTRLKTLEDLFSRNLFNLNYIKLVDTKLAESEAVLDQYEGEFIEAGYEGQMIRLDGVYENKRSKTLLKRKRFEEEEFTILDIEEGSGNRTGMMGRINFKTPDGKEFSASARGGEEFYKELLINKSKYIGKPATIRFQNYTPDGIPRFPVMITIRDYE